MCQVLYSAVRCAKYYTVLQDVPSTVQCCKLCQVLYSAVRCAKYYTVLSDVQVL